MLPKVWNWITAYKLQAFYPLQCCPLLWRCVIFLGIMLHWYNVINLIYDFSGDIGIHLCYSSTTPEDTYVPHSCISANSYVVVKSPSQFYTELRDNSICCYKLSTEVEFLQCFSKLLSKLLPNRTLKFSQNFGLNNNFRKTQQARLGKILVGCLFQFNKTVD